MLESFLYGMLGAIFPELLRHFNLRNEPVKIPLSYYFVTVAFVVGSGLVVTALPGHLAPLSAIYAGAAAPLIVSRGATNAEARFPPAPPGAATIAAEAETIGAPKAIIDSVDLKGSNETFVRARSGRLYKSSGLYRFVSSL